MSKPRIALDRRSTDSYCVGTSHNQLATQPCPQASLLSVAVPRWRQRASDVHESLQGATGSHGTGPADNPFPFGCFLSGCGRRARPSRGHVISKTGLGQPAPRTSDSPRLLLPSFSSANPARSCLEWCPSLDSHARLARQRAVAIHTHTHTHTHTIPSAARWDGPDLRATPVRYGKGRRKSDGEA